MNIFEFGNLEVCDLFDPLACSACTPTAVTAPTDQCGITKTSGKEALWIYYNCNLAKTDNWATVEDIVTDLTAGTLAFALEVVDEGKPVFAPNTIERGNQLIKTSNTLTVSATWTARQEDNTDIDFLNQLSTWDASGQLRLAILTTNNDLIDYDYGKASFADAAGFMWNQNEIEEHKIDTVISTSIGQTIFDPTRALPKVILSSETAYTAVSALAY